MTNWNNGYVTDINYTFGYYPELNPLRLRFAFLNKGLQCPDITTACELGFGQGISANIHAAASLVQWSGTDFNPSHAQFAQQLVRILGANGRFFDQSFAEFCNRTDLPDFDYVGLHGVWSWVNDENREIIVDFLRRKLKVGGVVYLSYNTQAGTLPIVPMRDVLFRHTKVMSSQGIGTASRINAALDFLDDLLAVNPNYLRHNPQVAERLKNLKEHRHNHSYIAHEYFNNDWHPLSFEQTADILEPAKLSFACSAHYFDHIDNLNLTIEQQQLLNSIPDRILREIVQDICTNQQFRRDYWVKGPITLTPLERQDALRTQRVILIRTPQDISLKVSGALGEGLLQDTIYKPILTVLANYQPMSLAQIEQAVAHFGIHFEQIIEAVFILIGAHILFAVQDDAVITESKKQTDKFNQFICDKARSRGDLTYLASPVIAGGIPLSSIQQLFLYARMQGNTNPHQTAQFVWSWLSMQNEHIVKNGELIQTEAETLIELERQAQEFIEKQLPILISLGICD